MSEMTAEEIIERLERGEVGREMDAAILPVVSYMPWTFVQWDGAGGVYRDESDRIRHMKAENIPRYTTSLDAAKALADRVITNSDLIVHFMGHRVQATTDYDRRYYDEEVSDIYVYAPTGPAAICALALQHALLKAEAK